MQIFFFFYWRLIFSFLQARVRAILFLFLVFKFSVKERIKQFIFTVTEAADLPPRTNNNALVMKWTSSLSVFTLSRMVQQFLAGLFGNNGNPGAAPAAL